MGSKRGVGGEQKSKMNYRCKVEGCSVTPRGCDVPKHYKTKTDWEKVTELREVMGGAILERQLKQVDGHTRFCFEQGFTETKLPRWQTHVPVPASSEGESSGSGLKQARLEHFQVTF